MSTLKRRVILTGAGRGIGKRVAELLLEQHSKDFAYVFTQRSKSHLELQNHLKNVNKNAEFEIADLELSSQQSRDAFVQWYKEKYQSVDVIFNNVGMHDKINDVGKRPSRSVSALTMGVNFLDTVDLTEQLYPILSDDGKIIEMSTRKSKLVNQPPAAQEILADPNITKEKLFQLAQDYINNSEDPSKDLIFSPYVYFTSKAFLTTYVRFVASKFIKPKQSIFAVHPGWVKTEMGGSKAQMTVDEAAPYIVNVITGYPFERHPLSGKLQFKNEDMGF